MAITKINTPELLDINTTGAKQLPSGTTAQRPATGLTAGDFRYNTDDNRVEYYDGAAWFQIDDEALPATCTTDTINYPVAVTAYYKMSDATDQTGNYNGTATSVDFNVQGKFGNAGEFNGSSSKIDLPNGITSAMGVNDFSFSYWINLNSVDASLDDYHLSFRNDIYVVMFSNRADRALRFIVKSSGGTFTYPNTSYTVPLGDWINITFVKSSTTGIEVFVNGASVYTDSTYTGNVSGNSQSNQIGAIDTNGINAKIDQVRIFPTALTAANVTSLYNEVQCAPTIVPSQHFNVNTYFGNGGTQEVDAKFNEAANFNGGSSSIQAADGISSQGTDLTFSLWFKTTNNSATQMLVDFNFSAGSGIQIYNGNISGAGKLVFRVETGGTTYFQIISASVISSNTWHNVVGTWQNQASGVAKLYLDGSEINTATSTQTGVLTLGSGNQYLGSRNTGASALNGSLDQVRIFNTALTAAQAEDLYTDETTTTAATLNFPVGAGCIAAYELDGNADDISGLYSGTPTDIGYTGMQFAPDFVWIKQRTDTFFHILQDSVRGAGKTLFSNATNGESGNANDLISSFDTNGFTVNTNYNGTTNNDSTNKNNFTYVAWNWKAAATTTTIAANTVGNTIASDVRANTDAGFSIVSWTGNGNDATVGTGLSQQAELVITKGRANLATFNNWTTYHKDLSTNYHLYLNTTDSEQNGIGDYFRDSAFTSEVFGLGNDIYGPNVNNTTMIAYCFASIPGFSDIGSYVGTGATGNSIVTGFRPAFLMVKLTSAIDGQWVMYDNKRNPTNPRTKKLAANLDVAENDPGLLGGDSSHQVNFLSNGFELLQAGSGVNTNKSGETYIFMAIAAEPTPEPVLANSFNTVIWSADGTSGDIDINSVGFQPDFVWAKVRTQPYSHTLFDSVRGVGSTHMLFSDSTNSESTNTANSSGNGFVSSFNTDGFTGATGTSANSYFNLTGNDYVAWCWKAGGLPAINNEGSIDSIVSANPAAGFSVVSTQSDGSGYLNFGHGLSQAPELVITKFTSQTGEWYTYTSAISNGFDVALKLNSADGAITAYGADKWSSTDSVVGVGNPQWYFTANVPFITYCFHSVDGYQKVGSYNGGSSGSSNVITIGFKPSFLIVKRTDQAGDAWQMFDSTMAGADTFDSYLQANTAAAEASYNLREVNFTNTGFYWTYAESGTNISGGTYIYLAIK